MTDQQPTTADQDRPADPSRRGVLRGVAVAGAIGALAVPLAACTESSSDNSPSGSPTGAGGGKPSGTITQTSEVPVNGGQSLTASGTKVVVTQPQSGVYKAFTAICTHRGCTVNRVEDNVIFCPCHNSEYDATTGAVVKQAAGEAAGAQGPLASIPIAVQDGTIVFA